MSWSQSGGLRALRSILRLGKGSNGGLSRETVIWGFRYFLGRDPESEAVIAAHQRLADEAALAKCLVASPEYRSIARGEPKNVGLFPAEIETVSQEDVIWCYRNLLGREPESEAAVVAHLSHHSFRRLVEVIAESPEFSAKRQVRSAQRAGNSPLIHQVDLEPNEIDSTATTEELAACIFIVRAAWTHLGTVKPHFSVLTDERYLPENVEHEGEAFWRSGQLEAAKVERILRRHGFTDLADKTCVEFGSGVGRTTMGLAKRFSFVHGYDISPWHLDIARQRADVEGVENVLFHQCRDAVVEDLHVCDFFYSNIVFQHNPPPIIGELIKRALQALRPDGVAVFQVPTYGLGYRFNLREWLDAGHSLDMQMHCLQQSRIFEIVLAARCVPLEVREDNWTGAPDTYISNTFVVRKGRL